MEKDITNDLTIAIKDHLTQMSYIAKNIISKNKVLFNKLEKDVDSKTVEDVGLEITKYSKNLKGNICYVLDSLQSIIKQVNIGQSNMAFEKLLEEIIECRTSNVVKVEDKYVFIGRSHKETNTNNCDENPSTVNSNHSRATTLTNSVEYTSSDNSENYSDSLNHSSNKNISLALVKDECGISQETDDEGWINSLDKVFQDFPAPKKERETVKQENDIDNYDVYEKSTLNLNENDVGTPNDSFVDGATPMRKEYEDETVLLSQSECDTKTEHSVIQSSNCESGELHQEKLDRQNQKEQIQKHDNILETNLFSQETILGEKCNSDNINDSSDSDKTELLDSSFHSPFSDHSFSKNTVSEENVLCEENTNCDFFSEQLEPDTLTKKDGSSALGNFGSPYSVATAKVISDEVGIERIHNFDKSLCVKTENTVDCEENFHAALFSSQSLETLNAKDTTTKTTNPPVIEHVSTLNDISDQNILSTEIKVESSDHQIKEVADGSIVQKDFHLKPNLESNDPIIKREYSFNDILTQCVANSETFSNISSVHTDIEETQNTNVTKSGENNFEKKSDKQIDCMEAGVASNNTRERTICEETDSQEKVIDVTSSNISLDLRSAENLTDKNLDNRNKENGKEDFGPSFIEDVSCIKDEIIGSPETVFNVPTPLKDELKKKKIKKEICEEDTVNSELESDIGDQLLALLKEIAVEPESTKPTNKKLKNNPEEEEAHQIYEMLQDDDSSDTITESDEIISSSDDLSNLSDILKDLSDLNNTNEEDSDVNAKINENSTIKMLFKQYQLKECSIILNRINLDRRKIAKPTYDSDNSVSRLCDLTTLYNKRKHNQPYGSSPLPTKKRRKEKNSGNTSDSVMEFSSSSDDDVEFCARNKDDLGSELEDKMQQYWAKQIFSGLNMSDEDDFDRDIKDNKIKVKNDKNDEKILKKGKQKICNEKPDKESWRNDPLLKQKLQSSDSSSGYSDTSRSSEKRKKVAKSTSRYEHDTDFQLNETTDQDINSDSDSEGGSMNKLMSNLISPIKRNIPLTDSSDSESDIEFVPQESKNIQKEDNKDSDDANYSAQKGRRNIRALMSFDLLAEGTQKARESEQERVNRLKSKKKNAVSLSQSFASQSEDGDPLYLELDETTGKPLVEVNAKLAKRLKPHQVEGVQFMWDSCYESVCRLDTEQGSGCILAHCMGLGKTFQVLTLIHTLFVHDITKTDHVLVVCPLSTVNNWKKESKLAYRHIPKLNFNFLFLSDVRDFPARVKLVEKWYSKDKSVLVMGYEAYEALTNEVKLEKCFKKKLKRILRALVDPGPDLVVCDEGHLLRNKNSRKCLALNRIKTKRRIVLTGTPLQNNLLEYYCMVQFVKPNLLGNLKEFKTNFMHPIANGQYRDSTNEDIKVMHKRTHVLHSLLKNTIQRVEDTELKQYLPKMIDHAVFIQLNQVQVELYNTYSNMVQSANRQSNRRNFLSDFTVFQYICTHPHMLPIMEKQRYKKIKESDIITNDKATDPAPNNFGWWKDKLPADSEHRIEYGNKMVVLKAIIEECEALGDKLLVFSQSLGELDLIEMFLKSVGTKKCQAWRRKIDYCRMDGTVSPEKRQLICDNFNDNRNPLLRLLLMSTKVGGLGLNLTAANRVVIMTVSWNPSYDTQSVFRVYRFGQKKAVFVYRFVSLGTMEEKVYQRTINKLATAHRVVDKHQISRHFKSIDLQALYSCQPNAEDERPTLNIPEDQMLAKLILNFQCIFTYHEHTALLENKPEDNLTESELASAWEEFRTAEIQKSKEMQHLPTAMATPTQLPALNGPSYSAVFELMKLNTTDKSSNSSYLPLEMSSSSTTNSMLSFKALQQLSTIQQSTRLHKDLITNNIKINPFRYHNTPRAVDRIDIQLTEQEQNEAQTNGRNQNQNILESNPSTAPEEIVLDNEDVTNISTSPVSVVRQPHITKIKTSTHNSTNKRSSENSQNYIPLRTANNTRMNTGLDLTNIISHLTNRMRPLINGKTTSIPHIDLTQTSPIKRKDTTYLLDSLLNRNIYNKNKPGTSTETQLPQTSSSSRTVSNMEPSTVHAVNQEVVDHVNLIEENEVENHRIDMEQCGTNTNVITLD